MVNLLLLWLVSGNDLKKWTTLPESAVFKNNEIAVIKEYIWHIWATTFKINPSEQEAICQAWSNIPKASTFNTFYGCTPYILCCYSQIYSTVDANTPDQNVHPVRQSYFWVHYRNVRATVSAAVYVA